MLLGGGWRVVGGVLFRGSLFLEVFSFLEV